MEHKGQVTREYVTKMVKATFRRGLCSTVDKVGAVGAILSALASPCCFPLFATVAGVLGLGWKVIAARESHDGGGEQHRISAVLASDRQEHAKFGSSEIQMPDLGSNERRD